MKILILALTLFLTACGGGFAPESNTANADNNDGSIQLFFSKPDAPGAGTSIDGFRSFVLGSVCWPEKFSQLWLGIHNQANSADNYFSINNTAVDIHFSPDDDFRQTRLLPLLQSARESLLRMSWLL